MKKLLKIFILFLSINISQFVISNKVEAQSVSFQVFYDDLSPYGSWYESPQYGYVWSPRVTGFTPYSTGGYWVLTNVGWTWASDYSWGWAPFHYGRWYYDPLYGYVWVPGYEWGPGWVTWRRSDDYYGWAPIGPGVNISVAYSSGYNIPYNHWHFVRCNDFGRRDINNYYIDRSKNVTIINNTTVINTTRVDNTRRTTFNPGPDRMEVQKKVGRTINPVAIVDENKPTQRITKNSVQLYRPVVENNSNASAKPAPVKITPAKEAKNQAANARMKKDNEAMNERKAKQPMQAVPQQQAKQKNDEQSNNQQPVQQQPRKRPIRDEQPKQPVKQAPVKQTENANDQQPNRQQPVQQQPVQRSNGEQPSPPVRQQKIEQPVQQQPQRQQPQPMRQQRTEQPQQNRERPQQVREMPRQQQPVRQAPVQRQSSPQRERKG